MNSVSIISQNKLNTLLERVCRPISYLTTPIDSASTLWDGPIKMCQQIESDLFAVDSVVLDAKRYNKNINGVNTPCLYHALLCRVYILLYYRHHDDELYQTIVFPRLHKSMGVYSEVHLKTINEQIDQILAQEVLLEKVLTERKKDIKPVFEYVAHNGNEQDYLYIEYNEEQLFRNMSGIIRGLSDKYGTYQDEANVWYNAKKVVHTLRDIKRPELLIGRAATALVKGQLNHEYEGSQIILICVYVMIRSSKDNAHFESFVKEMESLSDDRVDTDLRVIKNCINAIKKWMDENQPFDDYDYIGEQTLKNESFTRADLEQVSQEYSVHVGEVEKQLMEKDSEIAQRDQKIENLEKEIKSLKKDGEYADMDAEKNMADLENLKTKMEEMIIELLTHHFYNDEQEVRVFLKEISVMSDTEITDLVHQWVENKKISSKTYKRDVWRILHAAKYYNATESNWNTALRKHL